MAGSQALGPSFTASLGTLAESWTESGAAGTAMLLMWEVAIAGRQLNLLHQNARSQVYFFLLHGVIGCWVLGLGAECKSTILAEKRNLLSQQLGASLSGDNEQLQTKADRTQDVKRKICQNGNSEL